MKIAILLATYNRKQKTLACLASVASQQLPSGCSLDIYLTDDASSDGTAESVREHFPEVRLLAGTGSLFWAGGMRCSWAQAMRHRDYDYYLLLNDDTLLRSRAIAVLVPGCGEGIIIGATAGHEGRLSYGGWQLCGGIGRLPLQRWKSRMIHSDDRYLDCDFGNANIMLVARAVVRRIGILSPRYTHRLADYDYSLRAKRAGLSVCSAPGILGFCADDHGNNWLPRTSRLKERLAYLHSPLGLAYEEYLYFIRTYFPVSYPSALLKFWLKTFFPVLWDRYKQTD